MLTQIDRQREVAGLMPSIEAFCQRIQQGLAQTTSEHKRELVLLLVDRVIVTNGDVEIRYVIPTSPASEHVRFCRLRTDYFDHPASRWELGFAGRRTRIGRWLTAFALPFDVGDVAGLLDHLAHVIIVVALVTAEMLL